MSEKLLVVSSSPHITSKTTVRNIMADVIVALLPAGIAGCVFFGLNAVLLVLVCVASCLLFEWGARKIMKRPSSVGDLSAVVTGLLLAYCLPPQLPLWMAVIGSFTAIVVVKQFFGGIGQNFANPAATARIVLMVSFPVHMTSWVQAFDAVTVATPLAQMKGGELAPSGGLIWSLLIGPEAGCIGEVSRLLLLLGGIYLVARRVISPVMPLCFMGSAALMAFLCGADPLLHLLSGGLVLGAVFMATDYSTSPINPLGKVIAGILCGVLTIVIRLYTNLPEGVSYAILIMNIVTPLIEKAVYPKYFGQRELGRKPKKEKKTAE